MYFGEPKYDEIKRAGGDGGGSEERTAKWVEEQIQARRTAKMSVPEDHWPGFLGEAPDHPDSDGSSIEEDVEEGLTNKAKQG